MKKYTIVIVLCLAVIPSIVAKNKKGSVNVGIEYLNNSFQTYDQLQKAIWSNPELGFLEKESSSALQKHLIENGFSIEVGVAGLGLQGE